MLKKALAVKNLVVFGNAISAIVFAYVEVNIGAFYGNVVQDSFFAYANGNGLGLSVRCMKLTSDGFKEIYDRLVGRAFGHIGIGKRNSSPP